MFDIGASELLLIVVVAILVIGPKDLPRAMRTAGRWIAKMRKVSGHFRAGIDAMIREAELEEMEKEWKARNAKIMAETPAAEMSQASGAAYASTAPSTPAAEATPDPAPSADAAAEPVADAASAEARLAKAPKRARRAAEPKAVGEPSLPFPDKQDGA
ncbi:MAG: Sec-independent protein translocase protein TatB [Erythrobacter sp.]